MDIYRFVIVFTVSGANKPLRRIKAIYKSIQQIRIHLLSETGSDYIALVRLKGLEPTHLAAREPKSRMSSNSITGAHAYKHGAVPLKYARALPCGRCRASPLLRAYTADTARRVYPFCAIYFSTICFLSQYYLKNLSF